MTRRLADWATSPNAPALFVGASMVGALALQHILGWLPCPLCVLQRLSALALFMTLLLWRPTGTRKGFLFLAGLAAAAGAAAAGAHLYLLWTPQTASCGPGLALTVAKLVDAMPLGAWFLEGAGACEDASYSIFGLPLPLWSLAVHVLAVGWAFWLQRKAVSAA